MKIFDWYVFRNLLLACVFVAGILAAIVMLTQSLRFLELVVESGASALSFVLLTMLALPRFLEVILPLALMTGTLFTYNRMAGDSELIAMRAAGASPLGLAKPAMILSVLAAVFLWGVVFYVAPKSMGSMEQMRQILKTQFSVLLFRQGVFNQIGQGLTVYIRGRDSNGELKGLMIYDARNPDASPATITARRGMLVEEEGKYKVVVYEGSRQEYKPENKSLSRLDFERYTIDLPENNPVTNRWREPDERTFTELFYPDENNQLDMTYKREFQVEIHKRLLSPLLAPLFTLIACLALIPGPVMRRGYTRRIVMGILAVTAIQSLYLAALSIARDSNWGFMLMYLIVLAPLTLAAFLFTPRGAQVFDHFIARVSGLLQTHAVKDPS